MGLEYKQKEFNQVVKENDSQFSLKSKTLEEGSYKKRDKPSKSNSLQKKKPKTLKLTNNIKISRFKIIFRLFIDR